MNCSNCGVTNRPSAKFCDECGTALQRPCSSCGTELRPSAKFCDECGTPADEGVAPPATSPPSSTGDAVRKTVTVLFCDLVGSTAFAESVETETARDVMSRYYDMVQAAIDENDGTVIKFIGDGAMAMFGVPEVAEDDAQRAVTAGQQLQRRFAEVAELVHRRFDLDVGLRVGINTGEIVIADGDADLVGDALNTAARLEAACTPGEVLVGEETWRLTRSTTDYEVLGEVEVKGKREPIATFQVVETHADDDTTTPFVGRSGELNQLVIAIEAATAHRHAALVTVIGSPGVGKTRLAAELVDRLGDRTARFTVRCERSGGATFSPIADLLGNLTRLDTEASSETIERAVTDLFPEATSEAGRVVAPLAALLGVGAARSTEETFYAVRRLVELLAAEAPLVLVVDDIQWAEPLLHDLLEHLSEWVTDAPVLLLCLARPELREIRPTLAEEGRRVAASISLEGLDASATAELAARLLGAESLPQEILDRLPESTEGNPLFVRELVRMLAADGVLIRKGDRYDLAVNPEGLDVPPTIQSLLATRVERLPADERRIIELAGVVGTEFPRGVLGALAPDLGPGRIADLIERLRRKELIDSTSRYWGDEPVLRFHHVLIREAGYRRILKGARALLHTTAAEWLGANASTALGDLDPIIAFHHEQAHGYLSELGADDEELMEAASAALDRLLPATERAIATDDLPSAGRLARRGLAVIDDNDVRLPDLLTVACEALLGTGDIAASTPLVDRLVRISDGDERRQAWAACYRSQLTVATAPEMLAAVTEQLEQAAAVLTDLQDTGGVAKAHQVRAGALARLGRIGDCEAELDKALTAARAVSDRRRIAAVLGAAPLAALWGPSPVARAGGRCLDVIRLLRITDGSPSVEATSVRCQGVLEAMRGRFEASRELLAKSRAAAEEFGLRQGRYETELFGGIVELWAGEPVAAEEHLREAASGLGRLGIGTDAGQAQAYLARALMEQGRVDEGLALATEAEAGAGQNLQTAVLAKAVKAELLSESGAGAEAMALAGEAVDLAATADIIVDHALAAASAARVAAASGDAARAESFGRTAVSLAEQKGARLAALSDLESQSTENPAERLGLETDRAPDELVSNRATEVVGQWFDAVNRRDESHVEYEAGQLEWNDGRSMVGVGRTYERQPIPPNFDRVIYHRPVAVLGERLCVLWSGWRSEDFDSAGLDLVELDENDLVSTVTSFDEGDLAGAIQALYERHANLRRDELSEFYRWRATLIGQELRSGESPVVAHGSFVDNRRFGLGEVTAGDWARSLPQSLADIDVVMFPSAILDERGHTMLGVRDAYRRDDLTTLVGRTLNVIRFEGHALTNFERFDEHDLDAARARFRELCGPVVSSSAPGHLSNAASRSADRSVTALNSADREAYYAVFAEDFTHDESASPWFVGTGLSSDTAFEDAGTGRWSTHALSCLGERLSLQLTSTEIDGFEHSFLVVNEVDEEGLCIAVTVYMVEDLDNAYHDILDRFSRGEATNVGQLLRLERRRIRNSVTPNSSLIPVQFLELSVDALLCECREYDRHEPRLTDPGFYAIVARRDGLITLLEQFPLDQLDEARERYGEVLGGEPDAAVPSGVLGLDRESFPSSTTAVTAAGTPEPEALRLERINIECINNERWDELREALAPDLVGRDHRTFGWDILDRDGVVESMRSGTSVASSFEVKVEEVLLATDRVVAYRYVTDIDNDFEREPSIQVSCYRDGLLTSMDTFSPDDLAGALDLARQLDQREPEPSQLSNLCSRVMAEATVLRNRGESFDHLIADDMEYRDRRNLTASTLPGKDAIAESARALYEMPSDLKLQAELSTVAIRGASVALISVRSTSDSGHSVEVHSAALIDRGGLIQKYVIFDRLADAHDEMDRLWLESHEAPASPLIEPALELNSAFAHGAVERLRAISHPDFRGVDHKRLGWGEHDQATLVSRVVSAYDEVPGFQIVISDMPFVGEHVVVFLYDSSGDDHWYRQVAVTRYRDGRYAELDSYPIERLDDALALARQIEAADQPEPADGPSNRMTRLNREISRRMSVGEDIAELLADGLERHDHRPGISMPVAAKQDFVNIASLSMGATHSLRALAVRGERFALLHTAQDLADGFGNDFLQVNAIDEHGLAILANYYEGDDLAAAHDELDRLWLESDEAADSPALRASVEVNQATIRGDIDRLRELAHPEFVGRDASPLGWGDFDLDDWLERMKSAFELIPGLAVVAEESLFVGEHAVAWKWTRWGDDDEPTSNLSVTTFRDGLYDRIETFPPDAVEECVGRARELDGTEPHQHRLTNRASELNRQMLQRIDRGEDLAGLLSASFQRNDRRSGMSMPTADRHEFAALVRQLADSTHTFEPLANRGEQFVLGSIHQVLPDGFTNEFLQVVAADAAGSIGRTSFYDREDLASAVNELHELWLAELEPELTPVARLIHELLQAGIAADATRLTTLLAPNFVRRDTRSLGLGDVDRDGFSASVSARYADLGEAVGFYEQVHLLSPTVAVATFVTHTTVADGGGEFVERLVSVIEVTDSTIDTLTFFEPERLAEAMAFAADGLPDS